jgi:hypothetical protein
LAQLLYPGFNRFNGAGQLFGTIEQSIRIPVVTSYLVVDVEQSARGLNLDGVAQKYSKL